MVRADRGTEKVKIASFPATPCRVQMELKMSIRSVMVALSIIRYCIYFPLSIVANNYTVTEDRGLLEEYASMV